MIFFGDSYTSYHKSFGFHSDQYDQLVWTLTDKARYNQGSYTVQVQSHKPQCSVQDIYTTEDQGRSGSVWRPARQTEAVQKHISLE